MEASETYRSFRPDRWLPAVHWLQPSRRPLGPVANSRANQGGEVPARQRAGRLPVPPFSGCGQTGSASGLRRRQRCLTAARPDTPTTATGALASPDRPHATTPTDPNRADPLPRSDPRHRGGGRARHGAPGGLTPGTSRQCQRVQVRCGFSLGGVIGGYLYGKRTWTSPYATTTSSQESS